MAQSLKRLNKGQAPSLLDANKGNELIDAINNLRKAKSSANASAAGFILKANSEGAIEFDLTQSTANAIEEARERDQNPYRTKTLTTVEDGNFVQITFLIA